MMTQCPCGSNTTYADCCGWFHAGNFAKTAKLLMQSRYSAYVKHDIAYIVATTVPAQQALLDKEALMAWAKNTTWLGLDITAFHPKIGKRHAQVAFTAYFDNYGQTANHTELSAFVKIGERWYFLDPTVPCALTNKHPCLCGSGDKFKMCCGKFL